MDIHTRLRLVVRGVTIVALVWVAFGVPASSPVRSQALLDHPGAELYVAEAAGGTSLIQHDGAMLLPQTDRPKPSLEGVSEQVPPVLSEDGSTLALLGLDGNLVVRDGLLGSERQRFSPLGSVGELRISRDGGRLLAYLVADHSEANLATPAWKIFDTSTGELLANVENVEPGDPWQLWAVDREVTRLFRLMLGTGTDPTEQGGAAASTRLIAHDLTTGAEVGRLELPEVHAGLWRSGEIVAIGDGQEELMRELLPGLALSQDGTRLAIAHADSEAVTLIDSTSLAVEQTVTVGAKLSWVDRALAWLPLAPRSATAKALEGTTVQAVFGPEGDRLYRFGARMTVEAGEPVQRPLPLSRIELETGEIEAEADGKIAIERLIPAPDGRSLYAAGTAAGGVDGSPFVIQRLEAETLAVAASHEFPGWRWFLVRSSYGAEGLPLTVELTEMALLPDIVTIPADAPIQLRIVNHGTVTHSFHTGGEEEGAWQVRVELSPGGSSSIALDVPPGEYKMFCDVDDHGPAGMGGVLIVR
jgi:plastocyanin